MKFLFFLLISLLSTHIFGGQPAQETRKPTLSFNLRSIHLDFCTAIFINDLSFSSEFEIYKAGSESFGVAASYNHFSAGEAGGTDYGSPFHDLNLLSYASIGNDVFITTQLILGYCYRISSQSYANNYPVSGVKAGVSFIFNMDKNLKPFIKFSKFFNSTDNKKSAFGLGISIGWTE